MKIEEVLVKMNRVIERFYNNDHVLLEYETGIPMIAERCISTRIAMYLQEEFKEYHVDCEYDRYEENVKKINNKIIYPDIIVHKRKNNDNNLIWIEVKKNSSIPSKIKLDREKLKYVTSQGYKYKYQFGFLVIMGNKLETVIIEKYINGQKVGSD